ncbi:predicted protein [Sclerotinia sclerotiorum 1980 UF-70]|uniref:Uncharacterized protein n=1 Tax=Sclerotinia sclerotiorum (strain ATCC 18683 / 1980 / Ss-1) TaxID=665079 RepID=A7E6W1_SCLS1|nr:predicted protein [Sclerotinia sclerotiorum 1980 UF-70]EDN91633.1 predicted protein [Sclerotinia sclerotiorum 1980 UF-70]
MFEKDETPRRKVKGVKVQVKVEVKRKEGDKRREE